MPEGGRRDARLRAIRTAEGNEQTHPILRCGNCAIVLDAPDQNPLGGLSLLVAGGLFCQIRDVV
eukprot:6514158-Lingulodinium_polyedra.AAC.1